MDIQEKIIEIIGRAQSTGVLPTPEKQREGAMICVKAMEKLFSQHEIEVRREIYKNINKHCSHFAKHHSSRLESVLEDK